jgi:hypothetical protein
VKYGSVGYTLIACIFLCLLEGGDKEKKFIFSNAFFSNMHCTERIIWTFSENFPFIFFMECDIFIGSSFEKLYTWEKNSISPRSISSLTLAFYIFCEEYCSFFSEKKCDNLLLFSDKEKDFFFDGMCGKC